MMNSTKLRHRMEKSFIIEKALGAGFALAGITTAAPVAEMQHLQLAIADRRIGDMRWLERAPESRCDPRALLPGAKSVICCALAYGESGIETECVPPLCKEGVGEVDRAGSTPPILPLQRGGEKDRRARFARGADYHKVVREKLTQLWGSIKEHAPDACAKLCVDTSPILEKALAARAGLGWIGKHTILLNRDIGSWFMLGEIITDLELEPDASGKEFCGKCRACIDACPTKALVEAHELDANRCISYLTLESKGEVPEELKRFVPEGADGCDICQEACPYNVR